MKVSRTIRLAGATGQIRTATFQEREHIVVPVVALVEGVLWAVNSPTPELVLASEFGRTPKGWDGRPVMLDHPDIGGQKVSANSPSILESKSFGLLFNTEVKDNKLTMEAWLDPARAEKVGPEAVRVCERARKGEAIEISVGVFMTLEAADGNYNGKHYEGVWRDLVPDHLAMLPEGMQGACSNEMGCGAPRAASVHLVTAGGLVPLYEVIQNPEAIVEPKKSLKDRLKSIVDQFTAAGKKDMSGNKIMEALGRAAQDTVPGYAWIDDYYPERNEVIVAALDSDYNLKLFKGKYKLTDDENASITASSLKEVQKKQVYEEVAAAASQPSGTTQPCGCHKEKDMTREARVAALITSGKYKEEDRTWLNAVPETVLSTLEGNPGSPSNPLAPGAQPEGPNNEPLVPGAQPGTPATPPATPATPAAPAKPSAPVQTPPPAQPTRPTTATAVDADTFIAGCSDPALRESMREGMRMVNERRNSLITGIRASSRNKFTEDALKAKPTEELEMLADLAQVTVPEADYSGRLTPRAAEATAPGKISAPPSFVTAMTAKPN